MVRHGRLSKGCSTCRRRRIKCDQANPACGQCNKAGWKCPQYTDSVERMFQHHEMKDPIKSRDRSHPRSKALVQPGIIYPLFTRELEPLTSNNKNTTNTTSTLDISCENVPLLNRCREITQPLNDRAIDFFFAAYVVRDSPGQLRGYYEYLSTMRDVHHMDKAFSTSLGAAALAAYSRAFRYPALLDAARKQFGTALNLVKTAISSRQEAIKDSTVISVLLLNTFSTVTRETLQSLWDCHVHLSGGAMTLLKLRGPAQLETHHGLQLFLQIWWSVSQSYLFRSTRIPEELIELRRCAAETLDTNDPGWQLSDIFVRLADFRADVQDGKFHGHDSVVKEALVLDHELLSLAATMPMEWQFETILLREISEFVFGTSYHEYPDFWVTFIWNNIRTCRIFLHREVLKQLKDVLSSSSLDPHPSYTLAISCQLSESTEVLRRLAVDMCATIPQYFSSSSTPSHTSLGMTKEPFVSERQGLPGSPMNNNVPLCAGVCLLLWPILIAGRMAASDAQRGYLARSFRFLGWRTGIEQAFTLASVLESSECIGLI
ncbi:hypothetical protein PVAG01_01956 [Phlyctema vagabunda]|uniref:Zn(2)-C6 fungal-type domain-containing protein n=1 Tax=Phlyctema vagabunda TaxID=108571 RepID=A0ABR4PYK7_9HELO